MMQKLNIDPEEFLAWARGRPKQVPPPPSPVWATKIWSITVPRSRDVVILPAAMFSKREEP